MKYFFAKNSAIKRRLDLFIQACIIHSRGLIILALCLLIGNYIAAILPIMIPGSIIGLLILFFLLTFQLIPTDWIKSTCSLLMRYMTLLFIPAAMGIMDNYTLLLSHWAPILIGAIGGSIIVLLFAAFLAEYLHRKPNQTSHFSNHIDDKKDKE